MNAIKNFLHEEDGIVAIEYALMAALIALAIAAGATILGTCISNFFSALATKVPTGGAIGTVMGC